MSELKWRKTSRGLECAGYRVTRDGADIEKPWRLESVAASPYGPAKRDLGSTFHLSLDLAIRWAESAHHDHMRKVTAAGHFVVAAAAFFLFVVLTQFIGSMIGLLLVAAALYLALRSLGNGLGVLLNDAWGWTRLGRPRSSLLERVVPAIVKAAHTRRASLTSLEPSRSVRELAPPRAR